MEFSLPKSLEILERTPGALSVLLGGLSEDWISAREGEDSWSIKEVVAHLVICEQTNWMVRIKIILSEGHQKSFVPIDMNGHFELAENRFMDALLTEFKLLREESIQELKGLNLKESDLLKTGIHPTLGEVHLQELLSTWVSHDMSHLAQISRIIARQHKDHVGAFSTFLRILKT